MSDSDKTEAVDALATQLSSEDPTELHESVPSQSRAEKVLKERFVLESVIGRGGMGVVYKALDLRKKEMGDREPYIAIKLISANLKQLKDDESLVALQREAKKAQKLAHPNVATVYDFDRDGDEAFLCMELLEGEPLSSLLKKNVNHGMPFEEALPIIQGMARGLAYAHDNNIVHSDFKPGNVFITHSGEVKILDFGIARAFTREDQVKDQTVFDPGAWDAITPSYASPEMFYRMEPDPRDDIYALGCVCYELLCGEHPYERETAIQAIENQRVPPFVAGVSRNINALLAESVALTRTGRTHSIVAFLEGVQPRGRKGLSGTSKISISIIALAFVAAVAFLLMFSPQKHMTVEPTSLWAMEERAVDDVTDQKIVRLLAIAESHASIGRYISPPTSNAAEVYSAIIKLQPGNRKAVAAANAIADAVVSKAESLISENKKGQARELLERALAALPDHPTLMKALER